MEQTIIRRHIVELSDIGPGGRLKPVVLMNLLQNIASEHAMRLGLGFKQLSTDGMTWVARRYHIRIAGCPRWSDEITIRSQPTGQKGLLWYRDFEITGTDGDVLITASSAWIVLDLKTKRPVRPKLLDVKFDFLLEKATDVGFEDIPDPTGCDLEHNYRVRFADLDLNEHVNNAVYLGWAIETLGADFLRTHYPCEFEIAFHAETFFGHEVSVKTQYLKPKSDVVRAIHIICDKQTQKEAARLQTTWKIVKPNGKYPSPAPRQ